MKGSVSSVSGRENKKCRRRRRCRRPRLCRPFRVAEETRPVRLFVLTGGTKMLFWLLGTEKIFWFYFRPNVECQMADRRLVPNRPCRPKRRMVGRAFYGRPDLLLRPPTKPPDDLSSKDTSILTGCAVSNSRPCVFFSFCFLLNSKRPIYDRRT